MTLSRLMLALCLLALLTACERGQPETPSPLPGTPTAQVPTVLPATEVLPTPVPLSPAVTAEAERQPTAVGDPAAQPEESILIQQPGAGSRVTSPIRVVGLSNPTFEQTLLVRLVTADGSELALQPATIAADLGVRGPFQVDVPFSVAQEQPAFLQIFAESARDGGITHLASTSITLASEGAPDIRPAEPHREDIFIAQPTSGATVSGSVLRVEGIGRALFENTLVVDLLDADGNTLARQAITVDASGLGQFGPFRAELSYSLDRAGPGRVVVRDVSPAFGGTAHLSSVEVTLAP